MNSIILFITIALFIMVLLLGYELITISNNILKKKSNNRSEIIFLVLIILAIILIVPYIFTLPMFRVYTIPNDGTGQIGDTIGGLTAPFINGIGAILVYLAFKEQINATRQTKNIEVHKIINDRLNWLKTDPYNMPVISNIAYTSIGVMDVPINEMNKLSYILVEYDELYSMSQTTSFEAENTERQIAYLYRILYRDYLFEVQKECLTFMKFHTMHPQSVVIADFMFLFQNVDNKLGIK